MRSLLIASQKGGVGKSTTAMNLAAAAAQKGARVLLLDADPLGSVATAMQLKREVGTARADGITGQGALWQGVLPGLDVLTPYAANSTREELLEEFLAGMPTSSLSRFYDWLILDAPPMIGPRPKALLKAADEVCIVVRAEPMSLRTLPSYLEMLQESRADGGKCRLRGVLLTMPAGAVSFGQTMQNAFRDRLGAGVLAEVIPHDPEVQRALALGKPLIEVNSSAPAAKSYLRLATTLGLCPKSAAELMAEAAAAKAKAVAKDASLAQTPSPAKTLQATAAKVTAAKVTAAKATAAKATAAKATAGRAMSIAANDVAAKGATATATADRPKAPARSAGKATRFSGKPDADLPEDVEITSAELGASTDTPPNGTRKLPTPLTLPTPDANAWDLDRVLTWCAAVFAALAAGVGIAWFVSSR